MEFADYQKEAAKNALYRDAGDNFIYPTLGLAGETGEVVEKIKKLMRNDEISHAAQIPEEKRTEIAKEMGDVLWYLAQLGTELGIKLEDVVRINLEKLASRKERGTLHSEGDDR
jgi:NTP pyrophosphatase (non-canonical NTP hydrolase)